MTSEPHTANETTTHATTGDAATTEPTSLDRRRFLRFVGAAAGAAAVVPVATTLRGRGAAGAASAPEEPTGNGPAKQPIVADLASAESAARPANADTDGLILVAVQLAGGNDGLNTVVPISDRRYAPLRGSLALGADQVTMLDSDYGLHAMPRLADAWQRNNLAIVHGIGVPDPNLSHFASMDVWLRGSPDPSTGTGWIGRALDQLGGTPDPLIGVSIDGSSPAMWSSRVTTASLPAGEGLLPWSPLDTENYGRGRKAQEVLAATGRGEAPLAELVRSGHRQALMIGDRVGPILDRRAIELEQAEGDEDYESGGMLRGQLAVVADLIRNDFPTRAFHVSQGDYDTHDQQAENHPMLLANLDAAIEHFLASLGPKRSQVVVMTYSEFGRRPPANGSGTDHGTASIGLVVGDAVKGGHYGEATSLTDLDDDDNLKATIDFRDYLGGVAGSVLDVDPKQVATGSSPIAVV